MRSVLKSIQPQKQLDSANLLPASIHRKQPILPAAPLGNARPSTSKGAVNALNAQPGTSKSVSYAETAPTFQNASLDRKRDAEGRLRKENNYQAGLSPAKCMAFQCSNVSDIVHALTLCYHTCTSKSSKEEHVTCWQVQLIIMHQPLQLDAELQLNQLMLMMTMQPTRMMCSRSNNSLQQNALMLHVLCCSITSVLIGFSQTQPTAAHWYVSTGLL